jgi:hypothetical protein
MASDAEGRAIHYETDKEGRQLRSQEYSELRHKEGRKYLEIVRNLHLPAYIELAETYDEEKRAQVKVVLVGLQPKAFFKFKELVHESFLVAYMEQ